MDSGNRTQTEGGALKDIDDKKGRAELLPLWACATLINSFEFKDNQSPDLYNHDTYEKMIYNIPTEKLHKFTTLTLLQLIEIQTIIVDLRYAQITREEDEGNIIEFSSNSAEKLTSSIAEPLIHIFLGLCELFDVSGMCILNDVSHHFKHGAMKYVEDNWRKGIPLNWLLDSMIRHLFKFADRLKDERHDRAIVWYILVILEYLHMFKDFGLPLSILDEHTTLWLKLVREELNILVSNNQTNR